VKNGHKELAWVSLVYSAIAFLLGVLLVAALLLFIVPCDFAGRCNALGNSLTSTVETGAVIFRMGISHAMAVLFTPLVHSIIGNIVPFGWDVADMLLWTAFVWVLVMLVAICSYAIVQYYELRFRAQQNVVLLTITLFLYVAASALPFVLWHLLATVSGGEWLESFVQSLPYVVAAD
jgi:hypothetical protein